MNEPPRNLTEHTSPLEIDTDLGVFDGNLLDAIQPFFPLEAQRHFIARPSVSARWRHLKRLFTDRRGVVHFFNTTPPLPVTAYGHLQLLLDAVYAGFPPVPGYPEIYNYRHSPHYPAVFLSDASVVVHEALIPPGIA